MINPYNLNECLTYSLNIGGEGIVNFLVNNGAPVNQADNKGDTPLHDAAKKGN